MSRNSMFLSLITFLAAIAFLACAASEPAKKEDTGPKYKTTKAKVTTVTKTGVDGGKPIIEVTGTLPGPGWTPEVKVKQTAEGTNIYIMAVPGPGAEKGADTPFVHKFTLGEAKAGKAVRVFDHRGVQIKRIEK